MNWSSFPGNKLVESVSIKEGGDPVKKWRCNDCCSVKSETEDPNGTVCGNVLDEFSYDKYRELHEKPDITEEQIDLEYEQMGRDEKDLYFVPITCRCTTYTYRISEPLTISSYDNQYLNFWDMFSKPAK